METYNQIIRLSINDEDSTIKYANRLLSIATEKFPLYQYRAKLYMGQAHKAKGEYETSLRYLLESLRESENLQGEKKGIVNGMLGSLYGKLGEVDNMSLYYLAGVKSFFDGNTKNDSIQIAITYNNLAEGYYDNSYLDSARVYYNKALVLCEILNLRGLSHLIKGNIGMVYAKLGSLDTAIFQLQTAIANVPERDVLSHSLFELHLGDVYLKKDKYNKAYQHLSRSLSFGLENGLKERIRDASLKLSQLHSAQTDYKQSLDYYIQYEAYKDSIENIETVKKIADLRTEYEVAQKQAEVDLLNVEKRNQQIILWAVTGFAVILIVLALIIYKYYQSKARVNLILETQKQELEALNQTKDKFFSIISHDLRGPVSSFHGISRMIKYLVESKETDQLLEVADDIDQSVDRVSALLDNLLQWAMQQQGHFPNVPEKINLNELTDDLVKTLKTMATGKNINLSAEVDEEINLWVDKNTTMTILRNLVNNALKFTPEEGSVTISASAEGDFAEIRVSDTGVGIPKEKLNKLFKLQDKKSTYGTSGEKGLGLGLQLVYEFIEMNQGSIAVESKEDKGTTFTVRLPLFESVGVEV